MFCSFLSGAGLFVLVGGFFEVGCGTFWILLYICSSFCSSFLWLCGLVCYVLLFVLLVLWSGGLGFVGDGFRWGSGLGVWVLWNFVGCGVAVSDYL